MALPRFYTPQLASMGTGELDATEARHAASVLRLTAGQQVLLFDGQGREALVELVSVAKTGISYVVRQWLDRDRELPISLTLAIALPKGDRQKTLIDAATELGVTRFIPLHTRRGVAQPTMGAIERLERGVIEASKQCGRNRLMQVEQAHTIDELIVAAKPVEPGKVLPLRMVAHPADQPASRLPLTTVLSAAPRPVWIAIGPEGGFVDEEVLQFAGCGWQVIDLGRTILRVEIAAIAAVAQIAAWLRSVAPPG